MAKEKVQTKFKRIESKYLLDETLLPSFLEELKAYMTEDSYPRSTISNLYFDNDQYQMIQDANQQINGRRKLRIRSYEAQPKQNSQVFLEIKCKENLIGYKYRLKADLASVLDYLIHGKDWQAKDLTDETIKKELKYLRQRYLHIKPSMYIYYDRLSFKGKQDPKVRLTVDYNLIGRQDHLDLTVSPYGQALLDKGKVLIEVKVPKTIPDWLATILAHYHLQAQSFSKYGRAYLKYNQAAEKGDQFA